MYGQTALGVYTVSDVKSFFSGIVAFILAIAWTGTPAIGQTVFQYVNAWMGDGMPLPDTMGQATDIRTCTEVKSRNLDLAPSFGFKVDRDAGTFTDPASGITIKQSCITNPALVATPVHPFAGAGPRTRRCPVP